MSSIHPTIDTDPSAPLPDRRALAPSGSAARVANLSGEMVAGEVDAVVQFLHDSLMESGQRRFVLGLSGGIDSAVVALLAARAVGPDRLLLVAMPYGLERPARFASSTQESLQDARRVVEAIRSLYGDVPFVVDDIAPMVDAHVAAAETLTPQLASQLGPIAGAPLDSPWSDVTVPACAPVLGNLKARTRAVRLRMYANMYGGLVLGTENRTENWLGYFTIGGDEETDIEPISPYCKAHVRALAEALRVPSEILAKAPSADLWVGQTDEGELGFTYAAADRILDQMERYVEPTGPRARSAIPVLTGDSPTVVSAVLDRVAVTAFKRRPRPTFTRLFPMRPLPPLPRADGRLVGELFPKVVG